MPGRTRRHEILFCSDDTALVEGLTCYVADALNAADGAVVVVTEPHRRDLLQALRAQGVDIDGAIERGRCRCFDANVALDGNRWLEAISSARAAAAAAGKADPRVACCGERAGLLWATGRTADAVQLEQLCSALARDVDMLCVYPVPSSDDDPSLTRICAEHTAVSTARPRPREAGLTEAGGLAVAAGATTLAQAEEMRLRYAAIVEFSDDAIIAKTLEGAISAWNAAAERMFGYPEQQAIGQPITLIVPPDLYQEERDILARLRVGERVDHFETIRLTQAGERIDVSLTISPLRDRHGRIVGCSTIARDITKAKQAEAALRHSEQRLAREVACAKTLRAISTRLVSDSRPESLYAQILTAAMELMASDFASVQMLSEDGTSLRLLASTHFHPDSATFWEWVDAGAGSTCSKALSDNERVVVTDIETCAFMAGTRDLQEYRRSGIRAVQSTPLQSRSGRPLGMISTHWRKPHYPSEEDFRFFDSLARQAADLILAEETLATVSQKLIDAHEEERTRIARELHDDICQRLAMVCVSLDCLKKRRSASAADLGHEIGDVYQRIRDLASDIQALSHDLHPPKLALIGLDAAVVGLCDELSERQGITIDVHCANIPKTLPAEISLCLYRVLQEALQNAVKHGGTRRAEVSLTGQVDAVTLTIKDAGAGFNPDAAMRGSGLGLTSMTERLKVVRGQLSIHSRPGGGTTVHAVVPVRVLRSAQP